MIADIRKSQLKVNLLKATEPSTTPDDAFRPSHWCDRIYYLVCRAGLRHITQNYSWDGTPHNLASKLSYEIPTQRGDAAFEALERVVSEAIEERSGT